MPAWPIASGEMATRIRDFAWAGTPLGPVEAWSERLKGAVELMLNTPLVSSVVCGPELVLLYNDAAALLYGSRHPKALGQPLPKSFPETFPVVEPLYGRAFAGVTVHVPAQPLDLHDGEVFDAYLTPVRDEVGDVIAAHMLGFEISGRLRVEEALRTSEARLTRALEAGQLGAWELDLGTMETWRSPQHDRIFGYESLLSQWTYGMFLQHVVPEDRGWVDEHFHASIAVAGPWELECRIQRADGEIRWLWAQGRIEPNPEGRPQRMKGMIRDITERKKSEMALREGEERFRGLVEGFALATWEADVSGRIATDSPGWRAYTGQSESEWLGDGWMNAIHPDDRAVTVEKWREAVAASHAVNHEYRLWHAKSTSWRWSNVWVVPIKDQNGSIRRWAGINIDINERRMLQECQGVMVAELQHRTRNLMGVVRALADKTMRRSANLTDFRTRYNARLAALARIQGLLSKLAEGERITFDALVRTTIFALDGTAQKITLQGPRGVMLRSSTVQTFALALHELATNAMKYGAFAQAAGRLDIRWKVEKTEGDDRPWLHVDWREHGVEMATHDASPQNVGSGRELIERALPYQLGARTTFVMADEGVHCTIALPVSEQTVREQADA